VIEPGTLVAGRYRLDEQMFQAWPGPVWRAEDLRLHKAVVVSCAIGPTDDEDDWYGHRLLASHRAAARVRDPRVIGVLDAGDDPATGTYVVTEPVEAESMYRLAPLPPVRVIGIVAEVAEALQVLHDDGIVHRHVDAFNVFVRPDSTVLLGGLDHRVLTDAASPGHDPSMSRSSYSVARVKYLAPEQLTAGPITARTDVYSLGVVAYAGLTGGPPFVEGTFMDIAMRVVRMEPPTLPPDVPGPIRAVVERAMAKDPRDRWPTAAGLAAAARAVESTPP
jgi:serine/threonine-protein kinase